QARWSALLLGGILVMTPLGALAQETPPPAPPPPAPEAAPAPPPNPAAMVPPPGAPQPPPDPRLFTAGAWLRIGGRWQNVSHPDRLDDYWMDMLYMILS